MIILRRNTSHLFNESLFCGSVTADAERSGRHTHMEETTGRENLPEEKDQERQSSSLLKSCSLWSDTYPKPMLYFILLFK